MIPKISVVLLTCNRTAYVRQALDGVLQQSYPGWTLIASDCSSDPAARDEIGQVLEEHRRKDTAHETRIILHPERIPQGEHLRRALENVATPYIALLDDDDAWMPDHLARALEWLEQNPRHGLAISNGRVIDAAGEAHAWINSREVPVPEPTNQQGWLRLFMSSSYGSTSGFVFRREALAHHSFLATSMVDIHLALSVLLNDYQVIGYPEPSYYYRVHEGSSYQKGQQVFRDRNDLRLELFRHQGLRISRKFPLFPFLVLKSAMAKARDAF